MKIIKLTPMGGSQTLVNMGSAGLISFTVRYNYLIGAWVMDLADGVGTPLLTGVVLFPEMDLLDPHPQVKKRLGGLVLFEKYRGAFKNPDLLGLDTKLIWFLPGEEVILKADGITLI